MVCDIAAGISKFQIRWVCSPHPSDPIEESGKPLVCFLPFVICGWVVKFSKGGISEPFIAKILTESLDMGASRRLENIARKAILIQLFIP